MKFRAIAIMFTFLSLSQGLSVMPSIANDTSIPSATIIRMGDFSHANMTPWQHKIFAKENVYTLVHDAIRKQTVLKAVSRKSASGLFREQRIDLRQTPWLHWSWKTDDHFNNMDETQKVGDDFVARIYIVVDGGVFFWNTIALNYVWSSSHQIGETWANPFTSNATMMAVESGQQSLGVWKHYTRDVYQDLTSITGKDVRYIDAIAIMTDTDNSGQQAITYYGDIFFSDHRMPPDR